MALLSQTAGPLEDRLPVRTDREKTTWDPPLLLLLLLPPAVLLLLSPPPPLLPKLPAGPASPLASHLFLEGERRLAEEQELPPPVEGPVVLLNDHDALQQLPVLLPVSRKTKAVTQTGVFQAKGVILFSLGQQRVVGGGGVSPGHVAQDVGLDDHGGFQHLQLPLLLQTVLQRLPKEGLEEEDDGKDTLFSDKRLASSCVTAGSVSTEERRRTLTCFSSNNRHQS